MQTQMHIYRIQFVHATTTPQEEFFECLIDRMSIGALVVIDVHAKAAVCFEFFRLLIFLDHLKDLSFKKKKTSFGFWLRQIPGSLGSPF